MDDKRSLNRRLASCNDPLIAAYTFGHRHGVKHLATITNTPEGVMYNKLNPENESNHLQLREAVFMTADTGDTSILEAWCLKAGGLFVPVPAGVACDEDLSEQLLALNEQLGKALATVKEARADGVITHSEMEQIRFELQRMIGEVLKFDAVVASQVRSIVNR